MTDERVPEYKAALVDIILGQFDKMTEVGLELDSEDILNYLLNYRVGAQEQYELAEELLEKIEPFRQYLGTELRPWEERPAEWTKLPGYITNFLRDIYELTRPVSKDAASKDTD